MSGLRRPTPDSRLQRIAIAIGAALLSLILLALSGIAFGHAPGELLSILISGSVGSTFALEGTSLTLVLLEIGGAGRTLPTGWTEASCRAGARRR